jgi:hypothetical protein
MFGSDKQGIEIQINGIDSIDLNESMAESMGPIDGVRLD